METIEEQVDAVSELIKRSTVCEYGDESIKEEVVGNFEGSCDIKRSPVDTFFRKLWANQPKTEEDGNLVNSRDVNLHYLMNNFI